MSPRLLWPLRSVHDWLARADPLGRADLIFVLAGRQARKFHGLRLWQEGWASRILLSIARYEIRRFAALNLPAWRQLWEVRSSTPPPKRHFFVSFDGCAWRVERIPVLPFGTLKEIRALARWLQKRPQVRSLLIVSGGTHLRRLRLCCRAFLPRDLELRMIAAPESARGLRLEGTGREKDGSAVVLTELVKLFVYWILLTLHRTLAGSPCV